MGGGNTICRKNSIIVRNHLTNHMVDFFHHAFPMKNEAQFMQAVTSHVHHDESCSKRLVFDYHYYQL